MPPTSRAQKITQYVLKLAEGGGKTQVTYLNALRRAFRAIDPATARDTPNLDGNVSKLPRTTIARMATALANACNDPEDTWERIHAGIEADASAYLTWSVLSAMVNATGLVAGTPALQARWTATTKRVSDLAARHRMSNRATPRQREQQVVWDDVVTRVEALERGSASQLLLAMYTHIPPRRAGDYGRLLIVRSTKAEARDRASAGSPDPDERRPPPSLAITRALEGATGRDATGALDVGLEPMLLAVSSYKTAGSYGTWTRYLPPDLASIVRASLQRVPRAMLFMSGLDSDKDAVVKPYKDAETAGHALRSLLRRATGNESVTFNSLRHARAVQAAREGLTTYDMDRLAADMGHSLRMHRAYDVE